MLFAIRNILKPSMIQILKMNIRFDLKVKAYNWRNGLRLVCSLEDPLIFFLIYSGGGSVAIYQLESILSRTKRLNSAM